jgi:hypothetical protein
MVYISCETTCFFGCQVSFWSWKCNATKIMNLTITWGVNCITNDELSNK